MNSKHKTLWGSRHISDTDPSLPNSVVGRKDPDVRKEFNSSVGSAPFRTMIAQGAFALLVGQLRGDQRESAGGMGGVEQDLDHRQVDS